MKLSGKAIGAGLLVDIGGSILAGTIMGLLVTTGEDEGVILNSVIVSQMPAALIASVFCGVCLTILGGYTVYISSEQSKLGNVWILGILVTLLSFFGAVIDFHFVDPGRIADYITSASVPFVLPLTIIGGYLAQWRDERIKAPILQV